MKTQRALRRLYNVKDRVNEFEMEIVKSSKRNEANGQTGIVLLPGVQSVLHEVGTTLASFCWLFQHRKAFR